MVVKGVRNGNWKLILLRRYRKAREHPMQPAIGFGEEAWAKPKKKAGNVRGQTMTEARLVVKRYKGK